MNVARVEASVEEDFNVLCREIQQKPTREIVLSRRDLERAKEIVDKHLERLREKISEIKKTLSGIKFAEKNKVAMLHVNEYKKILFITLIMEKLREGLAFLELGKPVNILGYSFVLERLKDAELTAKSVEEIEKIFKSYPAERLIMEKPKVLFEYERFRILRDEDLLFEVDVTPRETVRIPYKDAIKIFESVYSAKVIEKPKPEVDVKDMTLGELLRKLRKEKGWTLREAEMHTNIPFRSLASFEQDKFRTKLPSIKNSLKLMV